jgi:hypothetical protein
MDPLTSDDLSCLLHCFATAVQETRTHATERSAFGRYRAGAPYFAQYRVRRLIPPEGKSALLTPGFHKEFGRISRELGALEQEGGREYREELFCDLSAYTEAYRTLLCYYELGLCSIDGILHDPLREEIAILLAELAGEFPLDDIHALVTGLDETFCILCQSSGTGTSLPDPAGSATGTHPIPLREYPCSSPRPRERTGPL